MRLLAINTLYSVALVPLLFQHDAVAELVGCDAVGCPTNEYHVAQCKVGNATLQALGITNVTTALDTRSLTWTVGFQEVPKDGSSSGHPEAAMPLDKNFYLGAPPSFRFDNSTAGCALFFEGISANITVPQEKKNSFTCADALTEACVADLVHQAESAAKLAGDSNACSQLRDSLMNKPPPSCSSAKGTWGSVASRPLNGGNQSLEMVDQSQCRATTGQGYDLFLVDSERHYLADRTTKALSQVLLGITPVMTVLEKDGKAKAELTCLRLVDSVANQTDDEPHSSSGSPNRSLSSAMYLATLLVLAFLYML
ncbi:uncharacterized protein PG986_009378 [Apiospora aurea]|uniref:Uncharacterized protein n=1 Tax=Apiospora aurea TaxID=335848 RepID=A0ABR1Q870_9PEZI